MTEEQERELIDNVKSLTDKMAIVDSIVKAEKLGEPKVMAFQCGDSRLFFPADYLREWGRKYGIGLGPTPVSETLQSDYDIAPPPITADIRSMDQIMHPIRVSCSQVDLILVPVSDYDDNLAVIALDDPFYEIRAKILRQKQLLNPKSRIRNLMAAWSQIGRK